MRTSLPAVAVVLAAAVYAPAPAQATVSQECGSATTCVSAAGGDFVGVASDATAGVPAGSLPGRGTNAGPGRRPLRVIQQRIAPACSGNSPYQDGILCTGAVSICRVPGQVAFWVWTREVDPANPRDNPPWQRTDVPPFTCFSADSPQLSPLAAIAGMVQRDFGRYPLARG
ncbi:MAG: hypothetical protein M3N21_02685, partial [Actinomycetota bacterium]|nr:hypothetical protein [Actinomycetota bacterium]